MTVKEATVVRYDFRVVKVTFYRDPDFVEVHQELKDLSLDGWKIQTAAVLTEEGGAPRAHRTIIYTLQRPVRPERPAQRKKRKK